MLRKTESEIAREIDISRARLYQLRMGLIKGPYSYPPVLREGLHWDRVYGRIVYTAQGEKEVKKIRGKKNSLKTSCLKEEKVLYCK